ncbi:NAD(P)-binding protein, partial [Clavulina sp. PMI_390]
DVPDLTGKVTIVTGGNTGIGKETAKVLLQHNAKVYIGCRSAEKAWAAINDLKAASGKTNDDIKLLNMDLANLSTVKSSVDEFLKKEARLDVLFNSAAVMMCPIEYTSSHGHDMQFGTNLLGHFYLTQVLLPTLINSAKSSPNGHVRVVNVSSNGHWGAPPPSAGGPILYDTLTDGPARTKAGTQSMYFQSKAGNILFSNALARKYGSQGIVSTSLNPGGAKTDLQRYSPWWLNLFFVFLQYPPESAALTSLYAGTAPEGVNFNGKYLSPWARLRYHRRDLSEEENQEKLWSWCEGEVKKYAP